MGHRTPLSEVVIPLFMALLLTAALWPVKSFLPGHHVPRWLATLASMLLLIAIVAGIFTLAGTQIASQSNSLVDAAITSYQQLMRWPTGRCTCTPPKSTGGPTRPPPG